MKRILSLFYIMLIIFSLASCSRVSILGNNPENVCSKFLNGIKKNDTKNIEKYSNNSNDFMFTPPLIPGVSNEILKTEFYAYNEEIFSQINYEIIFSIVNEETAVVTVKITNLNFGYAYKNTIGDISGYILNAHFSDENINEEEIMNRIKSSFDSEIKGIKDDDNKLTSMVDVNMVKTKDGWKVEKNNILMDSIYGGIISSNESMKAPLKKVFEKIK